MEKWILRLRGGANRGNYVLGGASDIICVHSQLQASPESGSVFECWDNRIANVCAYGIPTHRHDGATIALCSSDYSTPDLRKNASRPIREQEENCLPFNGEVTGQRCG